jgi:cell division protein FtsW
MPALERMSSSGKSQNVRVRRATPELVDRKANTRKAPPPMLADPRDLRVIGPPDPILTAAIIALVAFGIVMVYSASSVWAHFKLNNDHALVIKQIAHAAIGVPLIFGLSLFDYHRLRRFTYPFLFVTLLLLVATVFGFGHAAGGAARWLKVGPFRIQPVEPAKLALICWLAYSLSNKTAHIRTFLVGFLPHVLGAVVFMGLCMKQPDFGSCIMMGLILFFMLFTAGAHLGYIIGGCLAALPVVWLFVRGSDYRMHRILSFLPGTENYQLHESRLSFGLGGATGVGIGNSYQKLFFLPEAHTDFISAIIGEELGLLGFALMVLVFLLVMYRGIKAAFAAADEYGTYLAVGTTLFIGTQAFTNLAVAVGLLPTKGLVLPFISYGGSSLLVNCCCAGILLNVSRPRSDSSARSQATERANAPARTLGGVA